MSEGEDLRAAILSVMTRRSSAKGTRAESRRMMEEKP